MIGCREGSELEEVLARFRRNWGRRSRRIASKSEVFDEKKKLQEEQERQLEESDRKIELERKIRNSAVAKQRKLSVVGSRKQETEIG